MTLSSSALVNAEKISINKPESIHIIREGLNEMEQGF